MKKKTKNSHLPGHHKKPKKKSASKTPRKYY